MGYEYRLGKTEVTTGQWLEFINAALARPDPIPWVQVPGPWGAVRDTGYGGPGVRYRLGGLPDAALVPAGGITWRTAAVFCNWLTNGKSGDFAAFNSGAYDTSTFGNIDGHPFRWTDQQAHTPGAAYWIPTLDEWLKGAHFQPGPVAGTWWTYPLGRDTAPVYGPPPGYPGGSYDHEANSAFTFPNFGEVDVPLMTYPWAANQWGLLDISGARTEWTESVLVAGGNMARIVDGSRAGGDSELDWIYAIGADAPSAGGSNVGLRIAASIPGPGATSWLAGGILGIAATCRRRRRFVCARPTCSSASLAPH